MPLTIEAEITPGMSPKEIAHLAAVVEDVGFDRLGISDVPSYPDGFQLQTLCALVTKRILIGSLVTNPYSHHPVLLASAAATLQEVSNGRAFLGIGSGAGLEDIGIAQPKPVVALREAIVIIRDLLAGRTVEHHGHTYTITKAKLIRVPQQHVPLMIGTRSPQTMRLAGELADIAVIGARYWSPETAQRYRQWLTEGAARVGRTLHDLEVAPRLTLCTSHDGELARRSVKFYAAYYLTLLKPPDLALDPTHLARIEAAVQKARGWYFDADVQYPQELHELITDDIVSRFAIAGTPAECVPQVKRILDLGFTSLSMNLAAVRRGSLYDGLTETITTFGEVLPEIHRMAATV